MLAAEKKGEEGGRGRGPARAHIQSPGMKVVLLPPRYGTRPPPMPGAMPPRPPMRRARPPPGPRAIPGWWWWWCRPGWC